MSTRRSSHKIRRSSLLVADLVDRAFGGSAAALVMQALSARPVTAEQLKEIRQLIKEEEESRK